jgi:ComF family protein
MSEAGLGGWRRIWDGIMPSSVATGLEALGDEWRPDPAAAYCGRCGVSAGPGAATEAGCPFCVHRKLPWDRVTRLSAYVEPMDGWIKAMKFGQRWSWGRWFGEQLGPVMPEPEPEKTLVCSVPMPWKRRWRRGFNQAELMAEALASARGVPRVELLRRTRYTVPQTHVVPSGRSANVRGSLALRPVDLSGWQVWLVDDIKTSGATLGACCRLLKRAGATRVHLAVAAVAEPAALKVPRTPPARATAST